MGFFRSIAEGPEVTSHIFVQYTSVLYRYKALHLENILSPRIHVTVCALVTVKSYLLDWTIVAQGQYLGSI